MAEIAISSFTDTLDILINANPHARNKGDEFKTWSKDNFGCDARISYIKEQRQITNRVSEQFRYFAPIVVFVCVPEVKRETLIKYIIERVYKQLENVAIVGTTKGGDGKTHYAFEQLIVFKRTGFTEWAETHFVNTENMEDTMNQFASANDMDLEHAWYVGATGNNSEGQWTDFSDEFISDGIWTNGWDDKFIDLVKSIAVGDRIAIKSVFTQKKDLPFDNHGKTVGAMRIKAIGTVTENVGDGKTIKVDWTRLNPVKTWFGPGVLFEALHRIDASEGYIKKQLLAFTFGDEKQDYSLCEEKYRDDTDMPVTIDEVQEDDGSEETETAQSSSNSGTSKKKNCLDVIRTPRKKDSIHPLNFIIYGAPGTGKTYSTAEYALAIIENRPVDIRKKTDEERKAVMDAYNDYIRNRRIVFTTFHQSYGYEEFIQGLRPNPYSDKMAFINVEGVFKRIADEAMDNQGNYVIIIDEINRANISKVFGELITLIESDKRWGEINQTCVTLQSGDVFAVPNNLYIIGTMNSADKSISLIDAALRRRFEFVEQYPDASLVDDATLQGILAEINTILADDLKSSDLLIGHSYFMGKTVDDLCEILNRNIIPLLYEYYYDTKKKVIDVLQKALKSQEIDTIKIVDEKTRRVRVEKVDVQE